MYISIAFYNLMVTKDKVALLSETEFGMGPSSCFYSCLKCYVMKVFQRTKS